MQGVVGVAGNLAVKHSVRRAGNVFQKSVLEGYGIPSTEAVERLEAGIPSGDAGTAHSNGCARAAAGTQVFRTQDDMVGRRGGRAISTAERGIVGACEEVWH